jgi:hypothetical protein
MKLEYITIIVVKCYFVSAQVIGNFTFTWLAGSSTTVNVRGVYGQQGVSSVNNIPGSRNGHAMVYDSANQVIYIHGGYGYTSTTYGMLL